MSQPEWLGQQTWFSSCCLVVCSPEKHSRNRHSHAQTSPGRSTKTFNTQPHALTPALSPSYMSPPPVLQGGRVPRYPGHLMNACSPNHPIKVRANEERGKIIAESTTWTAGQNKVNTVIALFQQRKAWRLSLSTISSLFDGCFPACELQSSSWRPAALPPLPPASLPLDRSGPLLFTKIHCPHIWHLTMLGKLICSNIFGAKLMQFVLPGLHTSIPRDRISGKRMIMPPWEGREVSWEGDNPKSW